MFVLENNKKVRKSIFAVYLLFLFEKKVFISDPIEDHY